AGNFRSPPRGGRARCPPPQPQTAIRRTSNSTTHDGRLQILRIGRFYISPPIRRLLLPSKSAPNFTRPPPATFAAGGHS
ncbi:MAG: hypothetical protein KDA45_10645, partial [Planctomycetales bacterium]|nr:hypothetical protein [Planctomycetales bacterium]